MTTTLRTIPVYPDEAAAMAMTDLVNPPPPSRDEVEIVARLGDYVGFLDPADRRPWPRRIDLHPSDSREIATAARFAEHVSRSGAVERVGVRVLHVEIPTGMGEGREDAQPRVIGYLIPSED